MAPQLKQNKKLGPQISKISGKLLKKTIRDLSRKSASTQSEGVHSARKKLKQLRGILRLVQSGSSNKVYRKENRAFREAGRPLSQARDADVMTEALDELVKHYQQNVKTNAFKNLKLALKKRRRGMRKGLAGKQGVKREVSASLKKATSRIEDWASIPNDFNIILRGLKTTYSSGKNEMDVALGEKSIETLHAWRKSVKYLRYQLDILEPLWSPVIGPTVQELHHLADLLGSDHDLAVLEGLVGNGCSDCCEPEEKELLNALVNQRRQELQTEAFVIGPKLYAESPKQFTKRMKGYWKAFSKTSPRNTPLPDTIS